ncbi:hypothetical protein BX600DRAFT_513793 [Xylariales sp. PMI_506]|nr:hypothetical protein BX600DRAFT_513793 [Xylariales sp. PMI_506]
MQFSSSFSIEKSKSFCTISSFFASSSSRSQFAHASPAVEESGLARGRPDDELGSEPGFGGREVGTGLRVTPAAAWNAQVWDSLPDGTDTKVGFLSFKGEQGSDHQRAASLLPLQTHGENFENWWHLYQASAWNRGLIRRDYELLDEKLPNRVKSPEEWMRKVHYTGEREAKLQILQ